MMKSRRLGWAWHVPCVEKEEMAYKILMGAPMERDQLEGLMGR